MDLAEEYMSHRNEPSYSDDDDHPNCTPIIGTDTTTQIDMERNNRAIVSPVMETVTDDAVATAIPSSSSGAASPEEVMERIEEILLNLMECLTNSQPPIMESKSSSSPSSLAYPLTQNYDIDGDDDDDYPPNSMDHLKVTKRFNLHQCRSFTSVWMVLSFVYTLLQSKRTTTTREVYYFYVTHFRNQMECNVAILDAAKLVGVSRAALGLTASPKGWFCGCFQISSQTTNPSSGNATNIVDGTCLTSVNGLPITREWIDRSSTSSNWPQDHQQQQPSRQHDFTITSTAKAILVIEKEGVYNRLSEDRFFDRYPCILVTGKGYPDLATRALVYQLHKELDSNIPIYGICDCNPFGIGILQSYEHGSLKMGYDGGDRYSVPIHWLGLLPSHFASEENKLQNQLPPEVFQGLSDIDKRRIKGLLMREQQQKQQQQQQQQQDEQPKLKSKKPTNQRHLQEYQDPQERINEIRLMQNKGYKVELESLHWLGMDYMCNWIEDILIGQDQQPNQHKKQED